MLRDEPDDGVPLLGVGRFDVLGVTLTIVERRHSLINIGNILIHLVCIDRFALINIVIFNEIKPRHSVNIFTINSINYYG